MLELRNTAVSIVAIGCSHRSTPLGKLERMTVRVDDLPKALHGLAQTDHLSEVVVLSTCNRVEVYAFAERFHGGYRDVREFLAQHAGLPPEDVADHLYAYHDTEAVRHLFSVACGLDSAVVGEHEILGQIRTAWETAVEEQTVGSVIGGLFRHALTVGKRARTETAIGRGIASVAQAAVAIADERIGGISGRIVLVVGAGEVAEGTVKSLAKTQAAEIVVANRSFSRAEQLATRCGGTAIHITELPDALTRASVLVTTTGAQDLILQATDVATVVSVRGNKPLVIVDVAVPRDVDPAVSQIEGVTLLNMDDIGDFVDDGLENRNLEVGNAAAIVDAEVQRYQSITSAREVAPLISALRQQADNVRIKELERVAPKLGDLSTAHLDTVEMLTKRIINKMLHGPSTHLKDAAGSARGDRLAESLRDLYDLEP
ncbi:MAG: glutamyl-tRNA reductase [Acidimicrobiaceae bacterium]|nr:glutamyl-tRNA reductase [Acidimicrobiaceae bacterium]